MVWDGNTIVLFTMVMKIMYNFININTSKTQLTVHDQNILFLNFFLFFLTSVTFTKEYIKKYHDNTMFFIYMYHGSTTLF